MLTNLEIFSKADKGVFKTLFILMVGCSTTVLQFENTNSFEISANQIMQKPTFKIF